MTVVTVPNGIPFGSKSEGKLLLRSHPIQFERKKNTSFLSASFVTGRKDSLVLTEGRYDARTSNVLEHPLQEHHVYYTPFFNLLNSNI